MHTHHQDTLALVAHRLPVAMHQHNAVQLVVSLNQPYPALLDGQRKESVEGFLIDANIPHACDSTLSTVMVISVDANTVRGKALKLCLQGRPFQMLEDILDRMTLEHFRSAYWNSGSDITRPFEPLFLVDRLGDHRNPLPEPDPRIAAAQDFIAQQIGTVPRISAIAAEVNLSESRLRHLFVRDTGIPVTTYVLWSRMKVALNGLVRQRMGIGEAAHHAGYADHAHFSRTFKRMFGVSPTLLFQYCEFLQVFETD